MFWGMIALAIALGAVWLIYFRLLGRLAWYCTDRTAIAEPEAAPAETSPDADASMAEDQPRSPSNGRT